jgi:hypothetical protein
VPTGADAADRPQETLYRGFSYFDKNYLQENFVDFIIPFPSPN